MEYIFIALKIKSKYSDFQNIVICKGQFRKTNKFDDLIFQNGQTFWDIHKLEDDLILACIIELSTFKSLCLDSEYNASTEYNASKPDYIFF